MSKPKTTSELIQVYSGVIDNIVREKTQGSYTWAGVLGNFLNEWIEMNSSEENHDDRESQYKCPCGCDSIFIPPTKKETDNAQNA